VEWHDQHTMCKSMETSQWILIICTINVLKMSIKFKMWKNIILDYQKGSSGDSRRLGYGKGRQHNQTWCEAGENHSL
jgi:hypothetical protein